MCLPHRKKAIEKYLLSNKKYSYSKAGLKRAFNLLCDLDWIGQRESQLYELLFGLLQEENERDLIEELLRKVVYLNDKESRQQIKSIADVIVNKWNCTEEDTIVVGAKKVDKSDGADVLIYGIRNVLQWKDGRFRNTYSKIQDLQNLKNVIIADDFTGTGKRMHDVITDIKAHNPELTIRFVSICFMPKVARVHYPDILDFTFYAPIIITPGMDHEKDERVTIMTQIEGYLSERWGRLSLQHYHLGFKESGALYWNRQFRVSNNVYPIFWWGAKKDGSPFQAIMSEV